MKLNVLERIRAIGYLPEEGDILTLRVVREAKAILGFGSKELKKYNISRTGDQITWDQAPDGTDDIELSEKSVDLIAVKLKELDDAKKLTESDYSLYEKIVEGRTGE